MIENLMCSNNHVVTINANQRIVIVDGVTYPFKEGMPGVSQTIINGRVFIDGYELVVGNGGVWKRSLRALWHLKV